MPLFSITDGILTPVAHTNFDKEKQLQTLVEKSLQRVFNCRFVASELSTGAQHAGRIDTLALSEDNNPVIIEYKKIESSELINQSLYYLAWINDHRGDFQLAAQKAIGPSVEVDWSDIRVICIAPNYRKYDFHAVQVMGANLELWTYRLFKNNTIYFEEVFHKNLPAPPPADLDDKDPVMVADGKKAAETRRTGTYTYDEHVEGKPASIADLAASIREFVLGLDPGVEEAPKKFYVAYRTSQNIVCMEVQRQRLLLYVKCEPDTVKPMPLIARDVREIGHYGTGDLELSIRNADDLEQAKPLILQAYQNVGG